MRRPILRSTLLALAGSLLVAASVAASAPTRELIPQGDFLIPGGTGSCTFDVSLHVSANRYYLTTWTYPDGSVRLQFNGFFGGVLTNLDSGATFRFNASGPGRIDIDAAGNFTWFAGEGFGLDAGSGGIFEFVGRSDRLAGTFHGHVIDVCAALS